MLLTVKHMFITGFVAFCIILGYTTAQSPPEKSPYDKLSEYYYYKCYNQTSSTKAFDKLYSDTTAFQKNLDYTFHFIPDQKKIFCKEERKQLSIRIKEIAEDLKPCLPQQEKYLADFLETSFKEFLHFLCHNKGENIDRFFTNTSGGKSCREALTKTENSFGQVSICFSRIFKPNAGYITKKELCDDITTAEKCFMTVLDEKCTHYHPYKDLNKDFFSYISKPCSGCTSLINLSLLLTAVVISLVNIF